MFRLLASSLLLASGLLATAAPPLREAPNPTAITANQLVVSGNACGPTALLNAFRFGNPEWQRASNAITGETDKQRIYTIIREYGMRPSVAIKGRPRWSKKGVNLTDLCDIANEMTRGHYLPQVSQEVLFRTSGETPEKLLKRVHARLNTSLEKGLPPIISLRRFVKRGKLWVPLDAHFVTVTAIPRKLEKGSGSFAISYIDPWGGKACQGSIVIPQHPVLADTPGDSPCLEADFPQASVGKKLVRAGEPTALTLAAVLGRW
ncbi:MAG: hypothetical protein ABIS50_23760 [Luteolibacter sp.]|uniref:hypothetical protein n=1 Tax=Luteolibacter sp. TaxID=1962973 RepID=UPI0032636CED